MSGTDRDSGRTQEKETLAPYLTNISLSDLTGMAGRDKYFC